MWVWIAKITIPNYEGYQQNSLRGNVHGVYWPRAPSLLSPMMCAGALANLTSPGPPNCTGFSLQSWHAPPLLQILVSQHPLGAASLPTWHCHTLRVSYWMGALQRAQLAVEDVAIFPVCDSTGTTHTQLLVWNPHCSFSLTSQPKLFAEVALGCCGALRFLYTPDSCKHLNSIQASSIQPISNHR